VGVFGASFSLPAPRGSLALPRCFLRKLMNNTKGGKKKQTPLQMNLKSIKKSNHVFKRYAVDCNSVLQPVRLVRGWSGAGWGWRNRAQPGAQADEPCCSSTNRFSHRTPGARRIGMGTRMPPAEAPRCSSCALPPNPTRFLSTRKVSELTVYRCSVTVR